MEVEGEKPAAELGLLLGAEEEPGVQVTLDAIEFSECKE